MTERLPYAPRPSFKAMFCEKELWFLIGLGMLYFHRLLFLRETIFFRDLFLAYFPQKRLLVDFLKAGEFPLWDPYLHGGQPYLADIQYSTFYPVNLLYLLLSFFRAFNVDLVGHFIACAVCAYLYARIIGLRPVSSLITGVVFGYCGYVLSLGNIFTRLQAMPYLPLLLLLWHLLLLEKKKKWFVLAVVAGALQVLVGAPETNAITLLSLLGWSVFYPYPVTSIWRRITSWILLALFIVGVTAIQLAPTVEMVSESSRGSGISYEEFTQWSVHPEHLPEFIFPNFLGYWDTLQVEDYWGERVVDKDRPYILSIYFGLVVLVLAGFGGLHNDRASVLPFKVRIFLLILFWSVWVLSLGRFFPFFQWFYRYIPGISLFRYPIKFLLAGLLPVALLVGYAAEVHFGPWRPSLKMLCGLWSLSAVLLTLTLTFWFADGVANGFQELFFKQHGTDLARRGVSASFVHASAVWLLLTLLYSYRYVQKRQWHQWLLAGILVLDLLAAGKRVNPSVPENFLTQTPSAVPLVQREIGDGRLFPTRVVDVRSVTLRIPFDNAWGISQNNIIWGWRWCLEVLNESMGAYYRIPLIFHIDFDGLTPRRIITLKTLLASLPWQQKLPFLSASGVTLLVSADEISLPDVARLAPIETTYGKISYFLYRNNIAIGRIQFIARGQWVNSDEDALHAMLQPDYDPRNQVILQAPGSMLFERQLKSVTSEITPPVLSACSEPAKINTLSVHSSLASYRVVNPCAGYLVFAEPFYPGWRVAVDGKSTPIWRANYAFSAVFLPAGEHEVQRVYRPTSLLAGAICSAVFAIGLVVFSLKQGKKS